MKQISVNCYLVTLYYTLLEGLTISIVGNYDGNNYELICKD